MNIFPGPSLRGPLLRTGPRELPQDGPENSKRAFLRALHLQKRPESHHHSARRASKEGTTLEFWAGEGKKRARQTTSLSWFSFSVTFSTSRHSTFPKEAEAAYLYIYMSILVRILATDEPCSSAPSLASSSALLSFRVLLQVGHVVSLFLCDVRC